MRLRESSPLDPIYARRRVSATMPMAIITSATKTAIALTTLAREYVAESNQRLTSFAFDGTSMPSNEWSVRRTGTAVPSTVACQSGYQFSETTKWLVRGSTPPSDTAIFPGDHFVTVACTPDAGRGCNRVSARSLDVSAYNATRSTGKRGSVIVATS